MGHDYVLPSSILVNDVDVYWFQVVYSIYFEHICSSQSVGTASYPPHMRIE